MVERICNLEFDFSFLNAEPHSTPEELFVTLNGGAHLTNHLIDHRIFPRSTVDFEAHELEMGDAEKRICRLLIGEIEKVGGGSYRTLPEEVLGEGRRQAMVFIEEMEIQHFDRTDPDWRKKAEETLEKIRKAPLF